MCFRRLIPMMPAFAETIRQSPTCRQEITLCSNRSVTVKSNKQITQFDIDTVSHIFDEIMYQTEGETKLVEEKLLKKLFYGFVKIYQNEDSTYEIVLIDTGKK